jgi:predicted RNA-binding Zn ribbon-like protein
MPRSSQFELVAGSPALDLVNTVSWRGDADRRVERIDDFDALVAWAVRAVVIDPSSARQLGRAAVADPHAAHLATDSVRHLREDLHDVVASLLADGQADADAIVAINSHIAAAIAACDPSESLPLHWRARLDDPAGLHHALRRPRAHRPLR